jgi:hypothetical protein
VEAAARGGGEQGGGGSRPPVNEPVYDPRLAVIAVHRYPGLSGNQYRAKIVEDVRCSDGTAKSLLEQAVKNGWLTCRQVNRCNRYEVTKAGLEEVGELEF